MSTTVTYKGNTLTTVNNATKTLKTAGKYMEDDIALTDATVDLSSDTVTPATLMQGYTAHDASGAAIVGTATGGSIIIRDEADSHGGTIRHITGGSIVQGTKVITENGTYDVAAYADVNVSVPTGGNVYQDENGYVVLRDGESTAPQGTLSITANGTYDVTGYAGATVAVPVGMTKDQLKAMIQRDATFRDIDWPEGMTRIGLHAFTQCTNFNPASLPSGITVIDPYAFYNCFSLALTSLPSGVTVIGSYAFYSCSRLALSSLPDGIKTINDYAFYDCENLTLTSLPSSATVIGQQAFRYCYNIELTSLPSGMNSISNSAFDSCYKLAISTIPSGVTSIGSYAFRLCERITTISCDGAITTLGTNAFNGSSTHPMQITSASFPNMVLTSNISTVFGSTTASSACQQLEFCDIGSTTGIAAYAFTNCYALETLVLRKTDAVCTLANVNAFLNTPMSGYNNLTGKVYVPSALIESYKTATNWKPLYDAGTVTFVAIEGSDYER